MFDKWKVVIAGLVVGVLLGWGAWSFSRRNALPAMNATAMMNTPDTNTPGTDTSGMSTPPVIDENAMAEALAKTPNAVSHLIGKPLPSWNFPASAWSSTSKPISLESLRGSVTLVELFRINCSHCQQSAPFMGAMQQNYIPRGLKIIGIQSPLERNPDENDWAKVQYVAKDLWQMKYPIAFDARSQYLQKLYQNDREKMRWPTLLLLDRNGIVVYGHTGHRDILEMRLYEEIKKQLAK